MAMVNEKRNAKRHTLFTAATVAAAAALRTSKVRVRQFPAWNERRTYWFAKVWCTEHAST